MGMYHTSSVILDGESKITLNTVKDSINGRLIATVEIASAPYASGITFHCPDDATAERLSRAFDSVVRGFHAKAFNG